MPENNIQNKIDFAKFIIEHNTSLINLADTKAGFVLGSVGIILGLLFLMNKENMTDFTNAGIQVTAILLGWAAIHSFDTLRARLTKNPPDSAIYFQKISKLTKKDYQEMVKNMNEETILEDYLNNANSISKIQETKFNRLNWSLKVMVMALISLLITVTSYFYDYPAFFTIT
ncbi:MAG: DUF5706 domain-containing protein [Nitrosopumilus sp.]|nr:DUF5706 domain-containing protein [Nitrosopumilus sp.]